jgi:hypothetical protein
MSIVGVAEAGFIALPLSGHQNITWRPGQNPVGSDQGASKKEVTQGGGDCPARGTLAEVEHAQIVRY